MIRTSNKLEMENAIMSENIQCFKLACSSPIFKKNIIQQISQFRELESAQNLIYNNISIETDNESLSIFFQLFY